MKKISYAGYRFPPEIIQQSIWLYLRFTLSFRDIEDLLPERGIAVSYETVRRWVNHFGPMIAAKLRKRRPRPHAGFVTLPNGGRDISAPRRTSSSSDCVPPRARRRGAEGSVGLSCGEMALNIESVVDGGVSRKKSLGRAWTLETLHLAFSSPRWLM